jgi:hypothetical protein
MADKGERRINSLEYGLDLNSPNLLYKFFCLFTLILLNLEYTTIFILSTFSGSLGLYFTRAFN